MRAPGPGELVAAISGDLTYSRDTIAISELTGKPVSTWSEEWRLWERLYPFIPLPPQAKSAVYKKQNSTRGVVVNRLTVAVTVAVAGWALYAFSVLAPQSPEASAHTEIAHLSRAAETASADRDALAAELKRFKEEYQDLQHIQKQIGATAQELKHLEYLRARVSGEIDAMHSQRPEDLAQAAVPEETVSPEMSPAQPAESSVSP
jgi:hypothetical protein